MDHLWSGLRTGMLARILTGISCSMFWDSIFGCADLKIAKKSDKGVRQHPDHGRKLLLCIGNHIFCRLLLHGFTPMLVQVKTAKSQIVKQHIELPSNQLVNRGRGGGNRAIHSIKQTTDKIFYQRAFVVAHLTQL